MAPTHLVWNVCLACHEGIEYPDVARVYRTRRGCTHSLKCELHDLIEVKHPVTGDVTTTLIIGHVKFAHVRKDVMLPDGTIDPALLKPVARLGDITYGRLGDGYRLPRPFYDKVKPALEERAEK